FAVYSSFLQRGYDQLIHDAAISRTHIVLGIDRAGIVGEDGETHQGLFDVPMLTCIPNITVYSPSDYNELRLCLRKALYDTPSVAAVRYPRGSESGNVKMKLDETNMLCFEGHGGKTLAIGYGRTGSTVSETVREKGLNADVLKLVRIFPLESYVIDLCMGYDRIIVFEESLQSGGIGEHLTSALVLRGYKGDIRINAVHGFVKQAKTESVLRRFFLDKEGIEKKISELLQG
ncbi:MAG: transketolase C-terminal domain-containing protein, partial [Huintestinicola sp.]